MEIGGDMAEKLTFGDDQSEGSTRAWEWINSQSWPQWDLDVITVKEAIHKTDDSALGYEQLHEWTPPIPRDPSATCGFAAVRHMTAHHDPRVLLGTLQDSTVLVVGPRGKGLLKAMRIGSTTEWLMQCPHTPLLIAKQPSSVKDVLVCIDGSSHADAAVDLLTRFPWVSHTQITVIAAVEQENNIRERARAAAERLQAAGANVTVQIVMPDPLAITVHPRITIQEFAERTKPNLIAMGTKGLTGLPRLKVGSVASAIAHHVSSSVLLVRDRGEDDGNS
jgi:nucleotide-binding universal stress UspA family protein